MPTKTYPYQNVMDDRRRKIHPEDHEQIRRDYAELQSQRKTAILWNVSRSTIKYIIDPDKLIASRQKLKERGGAKLYYLRNGKEYHRQSMQKHRQRKRALNLTSAQKHRKPLGAEPIPEGYLTSKEAGRRYHAHPDTIAKNVTTYHFPKSWLYPLFKITELEEWRPQNITK